MDLIQASRESVAACYVQYHTHESGKWPSGQVDPSGVFFYPCPLGQDIARRTGCSELLYAVLPRPCPFEETPQPKKKRACYTGTRAVHRVTASGSRVPQLEMEISEWI